MVTVVGLAFVAGVGWGVALVLIVVPEMALSLQRHQHELAVDRDMHQIEAATHRELQVVAGVASAESPHYWGQAVL